MTEAERNQKAVLRAELERAQGRFHSILEGMSEEAWRRPSRNRAWSNGELMWHITFAYMLIPRLWWVMKFFTHLPPRASRVFSSTLECFTPLYHRVNALGPKGGAAFAGRERLGRKFDRVHKVILQKLDALPPADLDKGMHYPKRWDERNFQEYMTMRELFLYPARHLTYHVEKDLVL